jgi:hypothetical protein
LHERGYGVVAVTAGDVMRDMTAVLARIDGSIGGADKDS